MHSLWPSAAARVDSTVQPGRAPLATIGNSVAGMFLLPKLSATHPAVSFFSRLAVGRPGKFVYGWMPLAAALLFLGIFCLAQDRKAKPVTKSKGGSAVRSSRSYSRRFCADPSLVDSRQSAIGQDAGRTFAVSRLAVRHFLGRVLIVAVVLCVKAETRDSLLGKGKTLAPRQPRCAHFVSYAHTVWVVAELNKSEDSAGDGLRTNWKLARNLPGGSVMEHRSSHIVHWQQCLENSWIAEKTWFSKSIGASPACLRQISLSPPAQKSCPWTFRASVSPSVQNSMESPGSRSSVNSS